MMTQRSIRTVLGVGAVAALVPLATACTGTDSVKHGTVTDKKHYPSRTETRNVPQTKSVCNGTGKNRSCRTVSDGTRRETTRHPECWQLTVRNDKGESGTVCVSAREYTKTKVGATR